MQIRVLWIVLKCDVISASQLGITELAAWSRMLAANSASQRAFFTPDFARACETAGFRVRVGVLHEGGRLRGFLPFQFRSLWHESIGLAERVGSEMCDNAGLVAEPGFVVDPVTLLRCCGISRLFLTHLSEGQDGYGLTARIHDVGHLIDLSEGSVAYFAMLARNRRNFVADTQRRLRRAERDYGMVRFVYTLRPEPATVTELIARKRAQYNRSGALDVFADSRRLRLVYELMTAHAPDCQPLFTSLFAGQHWLASHFGLLYRGVLSYWLPVYNPAAHTISPGRLLLWHTLQKAEEMQLRLIDRGAGDTKAKREFSTKTARFGRAAWSSGAARARVAELCQKVEWRLSALQKARRMGTEVSPA